MGFVVKALNALLRAHYGIGKLGTALCGAALHLQVAGQGMDRRVLTITDERSNAFRTSKVERHGQKPAVKPQYMKGMAEPTTPI